jgi:hypothetical protein
MISKSTRAKRRRKAHVYKAIRQIRVLLVDSRTGDWLVSRDSGTTTEGLFGKRIPQWIHTDCRGYREVVRVYAKHVEALHVIDKAASKLSN